MDSRVFAVVVARDIPERCVRVFVIADLAGVRATVGCFTAVRDFTAVSRGCDIERVFTFVLFWTVRWIIFLSVVVLDVDVLRCFTEPELRVFVTVVDWFRAAVLRVAFLTVSATAPFNTGTTKQVAKNSFRPFIPSSEIYASKIFQNWASIFLTNNMKYEIFLVQPGGLEPPRIAPQHP